MYLLLAMILDTIHTTTKVFVVHRVTWNIILAATDVVFQSVIKLIIPLHCLMCQSRVCSNTVHFQDTLYCLAIVGVEGKPNSDSWTRWGHRKTFSIQGF